MDNSTQTDELDLKDFECCDTTVIEEKVEVEDAKESQASSVQDRKLSEEIEILEARVSTPIPLRPRSPWGEHDPYRSQEEIGRAFVGFASLPHQIHRKSVKKGFDFTLMVVGESGLGKSTLINSLFLSDLYSGRTQPSADEKIMRTVRIGKKTVDIQEKGVRLKLTLVDTPGFGDALDSTESFDPILDYIDQQFEQYRMDEMGMHRTQIKDQRVHCCLYFISPYGHGLKPLDVECMRQLQDKVNIIPVIAKADCLTPAELRRKKDIIRCEIDHYQIKIFQFADCDSDDDCEWIKQDSDMKSSIPFAVVGSTTVVRDSVRNINVRVRPYPWGMVEVENPAHSDLVHLRSMLVRTHMQDLKEKTNDQLYEQYRISCMQG